jgi:hypothetical protein
MITIDPLLLQRDKTTPGRQLPGFFVFGLRNHLFLICRQISLDLHPD